MVELGSERSILGRPHEGLSRTKYLETIKKLSFQELAFSQELMKALELRRTEDLGNSYCVDWLKTNEVHFFPMRSDPGDRPLR